MVQFGLSHHTALLSFDNIFILIYLLHLIGCKTTPASRFPQMRAILLMMSSLRVVSSFQSSVKREVKTTLKKSGS